MKSIISRRSFLTAAAAAAAVGLLSACGKKEAVAAAAAEIAPAAAAPQDIKHLGRIALEFAPSKEPEVIQAGMQALPELFRAEMEKQGYDISDVDINVGMSYEATGKALSSGIADIGWLPGATYALYSEDVDVMLTAVRSGLSNDSTDPMSWNDEENPPHKNGSQVTYYRSLIYAGPSEYGKKLVEKLEAGEELTWDDLNGARWAVQKYTSSAGYIYPSMWLMDHYEGKKLSDLENVTTMDSGYGAAFAAAAAGKADIIVCYADGREGCEERWQLPSGEHDAIGNQGLGRKKTIWEEVKVIGVTDGIYNDTVSISKKSPFYTEELKAALQQCLIGILATDEGRAIFDAYGHTGYAVAVDSDYDGARAALLTVDEAE